MRVFLRESIRNDRPCYRRQDCGRRRGAVAIGERRRMDPEQRIGWYRHRVDVMTAYVASLDDGTYRQQGTLTPVTREEAVRLAGEFGRRAIQAERDIAEAVARETVPMPVRLLDSLLESLVAGRQPAPDVLVALRGVRSLSVHPHP